MATRFWIRWNGSPVKITLSDERPAVKLAESGPTDEGYAYYEAEYKLFENGVALYIESGGCDCDGPISHYREMFCYFERLGDVPARHTPDVNYPAFEDVSSSVYDAYAVAAGY